MTLKETGEFGFIERIRHGCIHRPEGVVVGIGDDAAAFYTDAGRLTLMTSDLLVEGVHFFRDTISAEDLGHKALAVNLSDIAAMGGAPREAFVSIAIPPGCSLDYLEGIYSGMKDLARTHQVNILGGDTTASRADLVINLALTGGVDAGELLRRDGARPGDRIVTTGCLGDSRAGLYLLQKGLPPDTPGHEDLLAAHRRPRPHLAEGRFLATSGAVTAAMDVSDGLSADLGHILTQSGAGACLWADRLPLSEALRAFCRTLDADPIHYALAGGEDYVLLCTVDPDSSEDLMAAYEKTFGAPLAVIGEISDTVGEAQLLTADGSRTPLEASGWDHFRGANQPTC